MQLDYEVSTPTVNPLSTITAVLINLPIYPSTMTVNNISCYSFNSFSTSLELFYDIAHMIHIEPTACVAYKSYNNLHLEKLVCKYT